MAIVLPILLFILFGIIQWGMIFAAQLTLIHATSTAGRMVAMGNPAYFCSQIRDAAVSAAAPYLTLQQQDCSASGGCVAAPAQSTTNTTVGCSYTMNLLVPYVVPGQQQGRLVLNSFMTAR